MNSQNKECLETSKNEIKRKRNKVIHSFTVEIVDCESCPEMSINLSNPYINLSDEERIKDLVDIFGILWAETCRERVKIENLLTESSAINKLREIVLEVNEENERYFSTT